MNTNRINDLLTKYIDGSINEDEKRELMALYQSIGEMNAEYPDDREIVSERMLLRLNKENHDKEGKLKFLNPWRVVAAAVVVVITSLYLFNRPWVNPKVIAQKAPKQQLIIPGTNAAVLTLGNGKKITLNGGDKGRLAKQGNTVITRNAAGQISYQIVDNDDRLNDGQVVYNTITTPKGGQFKVMLPDGSNVWLNASSSLTYPIVFRGAERHVKLQGEAYFEIFKNKQVPFTVATQDVNIKVLGTHFNVMAYDNEPSVNTTLLEGSVSLNSKNDHAIIVPGQRAVMHKSNNRITLQTVNVEDDIDWKNGYFSFKKQNIQTVMNKIARWYNVDIEYRGNIADKTLWGTVSRTSNISELITYLELTGIAKFQIDGRRIIVICK